MTDVGVCRQCGTPVAAGARFCPGCGSNVSDVQGGVATRMVTAALPSPEEQLLDQLRDATLGEYEVLTELGRGGMATVYLAHDLQLDRKVAIKVMDPGLLKGEGMVERFKLEARTAAQLSHPHIIPIFAVRHDESLLYFVMKFVEGRPLDSIVGETGKLPILMVQSIVARVGEALGYAHRRGVVHRDIKPANIMIDVEGQPVVTDFGIAKVADTRGLTMTGATIGTPTYMSPEQCAAGVITGASDQYSLGVVAYEMLSGHTPFPGDSIVSLLYKHVHEPPPPFMDQRPDCPPAVHDAVMKMLAKTPEERFPQLEAAVQALGNVTLGFEDPIRLQLVNYAKQGSNLSALKRVSTPRSPTPVRTPRPRTRAAGTRAGATAGEAAVTMRSAATALAPATAPGAAPRRSRGLLLGGAAVVVLAGGALAVLRPWEGARGAAAVTSVAPAPASVAIQAHDSALVVGDSRQLAATALDSAGRQITAAVTWTSEDTTVATVTAGGLVVALAPGSTRIQAAAGPARAATALSVAAPLPPSPEAAANAASVSRIRIAGNPTDLIVGGTAQLSATTTDARGRTVNAAVTWSSSDPSRARVSPNGLVTALAAGDVTVTARSGAVSQPVRLQVAAAPPPGPGPAPAPARVASVAVSPPAGPLTVGASARLVATVLGDDGRPHAAGVTWRSRDPAVATVNDGVVTATGPGTTTITASAEGREGSANVTVAAPVVARPDPTPEVSPREAIAAVIEQYERALQSGQAAEVRRVYPNMPRSLADQVQQLGTYEQLRVSLRMDGVDIQGDDATANVSGEYQFYSSENRRNERLPVRIRMALQRGANGWRILGVQ